MAVTLARQTVTQARKGDCFLAMRRILLKSDDRTCVQPKVQVQGVPQHSWPDDLLLFGEDLLGAEALFFRHSNTKTEKLMMWSSAKPGLEKDSLPFFQGRL